MRGLQLGSYCKPKYKYEVTDVTDMVVKGASGNQTWTETQDHAKWCMTTDGCVAFSVVSISFLFKRYSIVFYFGVLVWPSLSFSQSV